MSISELISCIANIATAVGVFFAGYTYHSDKVRKRKQDTINEYAVLQENVLSKMNEWKTTGVKSACEDRTCKGYKILSSYLAEIERFCVGIDEKIYDFETLYNISHGYFDSERGLQKKLVILIEAKSGDATEDYFYALHKVWKRMTKHKRRE